MGRPLAWPLKASWLVVETTNFNGKNPFRERARTKVTERLRAADDSISYKFTVEDPTTWDRAWTADAPLVKTEGPIFEFACHETNYGIANILAGARADEKKAAEQKKGSNAHADETWRCDCCCRSADWHRAAPRASRVCRRVRRQPAAHAERHAGQVGDGESLLVIDIKDKDGKVSTWMIEGAVESVDSHGRNQDHGACRH